MWYTKVLQQANYQQVAHSVHLFHCSTTTFKSLCNLSAHLGLGSTTAPWKLEPEIPRRRKKYIRKLPTSATTVWYKTQKEPNLSPTGPRGGCGKACRCLGGGGCTLLSAVPQTFPFEVSPSHRLNRGQWQVDGGSLEKNEEKDTKVRKPQRSTKDRDISRGEINKTCLLTFILTGRNKNTPQRPSAETLFGGEWKLWGRSTHTVIVCLHLFTSCLQRPSNGEKHMAPMCWRASRCTGSGLYETHNLMAKVKKVNWQIVLPAPSVHCNSPSRIIFSKRLNGTLTELPAARSLQPAACLLGGKPSRSSLREDILPWQCNTFLWTPSVLYHTYRIHFQMIISPAYCQLSSKYGPGKRKW